MPHADLVVEKSSLYSFFLLLFSFFINGIEFMNINKKNLERLQIMEMISVLKVALPNLSYYKHRYNTCSPSVSYTVTAQLSISAFTIMLISRI